MGLYLVCCELISIQQRVGGVQLVKLDRTVASYQFA